MNQYILVQLCWVHLPWVRHLASVHIHAPWVQLPWACNIKLILPDQMPDIPEWCCGSNQPNKSGNHVWRFTPQNWMMKVRSGEWWAKPDVYWWLTYFARHKWCSKRTRKIKQPCKEYESAGSGGKTISQASQKLLIILTLTYAESAICRLSLNVWLYIWKYQKFLFLLTNTLHCSEIPHPGYKERHRHVFFNFVEVDNELSHLVTSPVVFVFLFISVLCHIVHWWVVHISVPGFCDFDKGNNNLTTSAVLSQLPASYHWFCTHSNIPLSTFHILPFCHLKWPRFHPEHHFKVWKH